MKLRFTFSKIIFSVLPYSYIHFFKKNFSINRLLFGKAIKEFGEYLVNDTNSECNFYGLEEELGTEVVNGFKSCYQDYINHKGLLRKYIIEVDNCIIEPKSGWGIRKKNDKLLFDSISNNAWIEAYHPSYFNYKKGKSKALAFPKLISINIIPGGHSNYFHFIHDLLGQVVLAKNFLPETIPFVISRNLASQPFFKSALLQSDFLRNCKWLILNDKYYCAEKTYFIQTMPNSTEQFFGVRDILGIQDSDKKNQRKIFLKRNTKRIRFISNSAEIESIAIANNFEIIDTDFLDLQQQIKLFGETKFLVGIHGAGLTNVIYRKNAPLHLLELLPKDYLQPHYFWLSKGLGHTYSCLVGSKVRVDTSFYVNPINFKNKLSQMLNSYF